MCDIRSVMLLDEASLLEMVYGGAVLGAGGGGSIDAGLAAGRAALRAGKPTLVAIADLPDNACLVTLSSVGPVRKTLGDDPLGRRHTRALELLLQISNQKVAGFVSSEVGALAVTYGWQQSILTGIPIVDAPCNGRAHPLGLMGSLGLHRFPTHVTTTVAVGGKARSDRYLELGIRTNVVRAAGMIRGASASAGIALAVARNPVPASYLRRHAALGGLAAARRLGQVLLKNLNKGISAVLESITETAGGYVATEGSVRSATMAERKGFTAGRIIIDADDGSRVLVPVCNEYMMTIRNGSSLAAFPDLITIFDRQSALPLNSTELKAGQRVAILIVPRQNLNLGSTMGDRSLLRPIEDLLKIRFPADGSASL
jgi:uncharacterized protein